MKALKANLVLLVLPNLNFRNNKFTNIEEGEAIWIFISEQPSTEGQPNQHVQPDYPVVDMPETEDESLPDEDQDRRYPVPSIVPSTTFTPA